MRLALFLALFALPATAQQRASDTAFTAEDLAETLSGQRVEFFDASAARYYADGTYEYRYSPDDPVWRGTWETAGTEVCVTFDNGFSRCDAYVLDGERLVMIIEDGTRFPVRGVTDIPPT